VGPLINALEMGYPPVCSAAAIALGKLKDPQALKPLIGALYDESVRVCCAAAMALGELGDNHAIEYLSIMCSHDSRHIREAARSALEKFSPEARLRTSVAPLLDEDFDGDPDDF
jgi:HEAT repeat protein